MELEDLKSTWKSLENEIGQMSENGTDDIVIDHKDDIKSCLIKRFGWGIFVATVATGFLCTSRFWAPVKMPVWWICAVCFLLILGIISTFLLINEIKRINLGEDTQYQVLKQILSIKRLYRYMELYGCAAVLVLMICGVIASPIRYKIIEIVIISTATVVCFFSEYLIYKSNIKKLNKMQDWLD